MDRTLGLKIQLNYIQNGFVDLYSVKFPYRINTNIDYVEYSWNTKLLHRPVQYSIRVVPHDSSILSLLQIPSIGILPLNVETFEIAYRCIGIKAGKFDLHVNFNFTWPSSANQTKVTLKQEKLCANREIRLAYGFCLIHLFRE
ncbi:unnamed protein product [Thelazia callipaeda]|uniref:WIF domain-containing protein n=1 Tax=Thelazia callipaeda TaxID=103827 RepID=A0A0N5CSD5_THECL|nr:unnamed protein product [Thelazia callipaeda]